MLLLCKYILKKKTAIFFSRLNATAQCAAQYQVEHCPRIVRKRRNFDEVVMSLTGSSGLELGVYRHIVFARVSFRLAHFIPRGSFGTKQHPRAAPGGSVPPLCRQRRCASKGEVWGAAVPIKPYHAWPRGRLKEILVENKKPKYRQY